MDTATLSFFEQQPEALPLYEAFAGAVMDQYPDTRIKVQKSQISFSNRYLFACVSFARVKKEERAARSLPCDHAWHALSAGISPCGREDRTLSGAVDDAYRDRISR